MEIEVLWADRSDRPMYENHQMAECGFESEVISDVVNVKFERERTYRDYQEPYPELSLVHSDGSVTRGRGRFKSVSGQMGSVKSVDYNNRRNYLVARDFRNCFGVYWKCSSDEFGKIQKELSILYWDDEEQMVHIDTIRPEYVTVKYPNGDTITKGSLPLDDVSFVTDHTSPTMTLTVEDNGAGRVIEGVNSVTVNKLGVENRKFKVHRSDGIVETVDDIVDVEGPNYLLQEVETNGPYTEVKTSFGSLSVMDSIESDKLSEGDLYSVYINDSISKSAGVRKKNFDTKFRKSRDVFVVSPNGNQSHLERSKGRS